MASTPSPRRILITGATGFVGRALVSRLGVEGRVVRAAVRTSGVALAPGVEAVAVGEIGAATEWRAAVSGIDAVVHLAARVHVTGDDARTGEGLFRAVNVDGAVGIARAARDGTGSTVRPGQQHHGLRRSERARALRRVESTGAHDALRALQAGRRARRRRGTRRFGYGTGRTEAAPGLRSWGEGQLRAPRPPGRARHPAAARVGAQPAQSPFRRQPGRWDRARARSPRCGGPDVQRDRSAGRLDARAGLGDRRGARPSPTLAALPGRSPARCGCARRSQRRAQPAGRRHGGRCVAHPRRTGLGAAVHARAGPRAKRRRQPG